MSSISYIIPSLNRETLHRTIASIEMWPGDEICVEYDIPRTNRWGNDQRNKAMSRAIGDYLAFIDDDDWYVEGHRAMMQRAIDDNPDRPILFQMQYPKGQVLWATKEIKPGNVSTPQILVPNKKWMLYHWEGARNMADYLFISKWKWTKEMVVWQEQILVNLGHSDGEARHHD